MPLQIKRPEKVVSLCLDASLRVEWEAAEADLIKARKAPSSDRITGNPEIARLTELILDLEDRMLAQVALFRLQGVQRSKWAELIAKHPANADDVEDKNFGANRAAFFDEIIPLSIVSVTQADEPVPFDAGKEWSALADEMTDQQYAEFVEAVFVLNRGQVSVPFSRAVSR